jgi:hypothetical protein
MPAARTIRQLNLRVGREADVRNMPTRFEDALRTASLPDANGRLVFVRRLDLGRIRGDSSSIRLSRLLAEAFEREHPQCLHAMAEHADTAPAVWFRDALQAHTLLALRLAAGHHCHAWFWRIAVPGVVTDASVVQQLRTIVLSLSTHAEASAAIAHWASALVRAGHLRLLIEVLDMPTTACLAAATGVMLADRSTPLNDDGVESDDSSHRRTTADKAAEHDQRTPVSTTATAASIAPDERAYRLLQTWLQTIGDAVAINILRSADARSIALVRPLAQAIVLPKDIDRVRNNTSDSNDDRVDRAMSSQVLETHETQEPVTAFDSIASIKSDKTPDHSAGREALLHDVSLDESRESAQTVRNKLEAHLVDAAPTVAGGVAFLLNVLNRLGYPEWLQAQPEWTERAMTSRIFSHALNAMNVSPDDPAWALTEMDVPYSPPPRAFVAPERWRKGLMARGGSQLRHETSAAVAWTDASGRLLLAVQWGDDATTALPLEAQSLPMACPARALDDPDRQVAAAWSIAVHRWLRRYARIGLIDLLRRPAHLSLTPTHLDVWFDPAHADLRLRRVGLDLDPGWLPWWGKVVGFHYERCAFASANQGSP